MLTKDEARSFCIKKLCIELNNRSVETDGLELLNDIVISIQAKIPFQNLRLLSLPPSERHRPSLAEIKTDLLAGVGGLCYNLNVAAYFLLKALGYKVSLAHSTCTSSVLSPNNHIVVYVHDVVAKGDKYLVEVGVGFPTFRAIDLGFEKESPVFVDSYLEYKYIKHQGKILRMNRKGCPVIASGVKNPVTDYYIDDWRRFYMADEDSTTDLSVFDECFERVWNDKTASPFHGSFRCFSCPNKRAVMIVNKKLMKDMGTGSLEVEEIKENKDDFIKILKQHFPFLPDIMIEQAWKHVKESQ